MIKLRDAAQMGTVAVTLLLGCTTVVDAATKSTSSGQAHCEHQAQNDYNDRNARCENNFASNVLFTTTYLDCLNMAEEIHENDLAECKEDETSSPVRTRGVGGPMSIKLASPPRT